MGRMQEAAEHRFVLVVDDCVDDFEIIRRAIHRTVPGADVRWATDGLEAMAVLNSPGAPIPNLLLMDYRMPAVSGLETIEAIRALASLPRFPIVMLAGRVCDNDLEKVYIAGANSWIEKQTDYEAFMADIGRAAQYWLHLNEAVPPLAKRVRAGSAFLSS